MDSEADIVERNDAAIVEAMADMVESDEVLRLLQRLDHWDARLRMKASSAFMSPLLLCKTLKYSFAAVFTAL